MTFWTQALRRYFPTGTACCVAAMGKKPGALTAAQSASVDQLLEQGDTLLAQQQFREAYDCLTEATTLGPGKPLGWFHLGLAASELWETEGLAEDPENFFPTALHALRKVLRIDTSGRAEVRYLASVAAGRLLTKKMTQVMEESEGEMSEADGDALVAEALGFFQEAQRLVVEWGHVDLGVTWGDWGKAQSLQMKRLMEGAERRAKGEAVNWQELLGVLSKLCDEAVEKFGKAQTAISDETFDDVMEEDGDLDWMVLQVEHLLYFVNFATVALKHSQCLETNVAWLRHGLIAWRAALPLTLAVRQLSPGHFGALLGDTFAAACRLLLAAPAVTLALRAEGTVTTGTTTSFFGAVGLRVPEAPRSGESGEVVETLPLEATEEDLAKMAEAAYIAAVAPLQLGELQLDLARMAQRFQKDPKPHLQKAAEAFQSVPKGEDKSVAWYNMACVAALADRPEAAAKAMKMCLQGLKASEKRSWMQEANEDPDLQPILGTAEMKALFSGGYR